MEGDLNTALNQRTMTRRDMMIESAALCLSATSLSARGAANAKVRVCLLLEPGLPREGAPPNLEALLAATPDASVSKCGVEEILENGVEADVFCNSHGSVYPAAIGEKVFEFLARGGSLLHVGGIPFDQAVEREGRQWVSDEKTGKELREKLGMHRYVPAYPFDGVRGLRQSFDPLLIGLGPASNDLPQNSLNVTTTLPLHVADPAQFGLYSVTYLSKPVCRHTHIAGQLEDPAGRAILSSVLFTKTWRNPYDAARAQPGGPWAIATAIYGGPLPAELFSRLWAWIASPAFLGQVELESATLRPGEKTNVTAQIHGELRPGWKVSAQAVDLTVEEWRRGATPQWAKVNAELGAFQVTAQIRDEGKQDAFLFAVRFLLSDETGHVRDYSESAAVAWRPEALKSGPSLRRNGAYLDYSMQGLDRPASFVMGSNWQDSEVYGLTWHNPNPLRVAADARSMAEAGLRVMRVHYNMPESLRVLNADVFRRTHADFYHSFEPGPELTERHLRALEAHAMVFGRLGILFMPTVYTNVGPSMGNVQQWMTTSERYEVPDMIEAQKVFARQVMARLGVLPSITWDVINESDKAMPTVGRWLEGMRPIWGSTGQLLGIGTSMLTMNLSLGESPDWHSIHTDCIKGKANQVFNSGKPFFYHELYVPTPATAQGEADVERILSQTIARTVVRGACGLMPWNWNKLAAYWKYGMSWVESWDHDLGACTQGEGVRRRGWFAMRNWAALLDGVSFDQSHRAQIAYLYPRFTVTGDRPEIWLDTIRKQNLACMAINDREVEKADLTRTRLVIVPHYGMGYRLSTYQKLLAFAAQGGIVWAHADSFRRDENGKLDGNRQVHFTDDRVAAGSGAIEWHFGWTLPDRTISRFEQLLHSMDWARPAKGHIPLLAGELRFAGDDELESIRTVQLVDANGTVARAWSGDGSPLSWPGICLSTPGQLFVRRQSPGTFSVYGEQVRVTASGPLTASIREHAGYELTRRKEGEDVIIQPQGWQRGYWFDLTVG
jgi:hypothetical protein